MRKERWYIKASLEAVRLLVLDQQCSREKHDLHTTGHRITQFKKYEKSYQVYISVLQLLALNS
jgi:hypothetical protein